MTIRTRETMVTFRRSFALGGIDEVLPAGAYIVETDEAPLDGVSFLAYRRIQTLLHLQAKFGSPGTTRTWTVDPKELDAALKRDRASAVAKSDADVRS